MMLLKKDCWDVVERGLCPPQVVQHSAIGEFDDRRDMVKIPRALVENVFCNCAPASEVPRVGGRSRFPFSDRSRLCPNRKDA